MLGELMRLARLLRDVCEALLAEGRVAQRTTTGLPRERRVGHDLRGRAVRLAVAVVVVRLGRFRALGGELVRTLAPETIQTVIEGALAGYCEDEGARSLHRAISNKLVDII